MHPSDIESLGFQEGSVVTACAAADDGVVREVSGLTIKPYALPIGSVGGYYPELNPLVPLWHHAKDSQVPAAKSIPIRLR